MVTMRSAITLTTIILLIFSCQYYVTNALPVLKTDVSRSEDDPHGQPISRITIESVGFILSRNCCGILVHNRWMLTVASCLKTVTKPENLKVHFYSHKVANPIIVNVLDFQYFPHFEDLYKMSDLSFALLFLKENKKLRKIVKYRVNGAVEIVSSLRNTGDVVIPVTERKVTVSSFKQLRLQFLSFTDGDDCAVRKTGSSFCTQKINVDNHGLSSKSCQIYKGSPIIYQSTHNKKISQVVLGLLMISRQCSGEKQGEIENWKFMPLYQFAKWIQKTIRITGRSKFLFFYDSILHVVLIVEAKCQSAWSSNLNTREDHDLPFPVIFLRKENVDA